MHRIVNDNASSRQPLSTSYKRTKPAYASLGLHSPTVEKSVQHIILKTRTQTVTIDRLLKAWEINRLFHEDYRPRSLDDRFHAVRVNSKSRCLCGWASLEHQDFVSLPVETATVQSNDELSQPSEGRSAPTAVCEGSDILALHISTMDGIQDGFRAGYWVPWHSAFNVLFVRSKGINNVFERIGVGTLFGREVDRIFAQSELQEVVLV